jgi:hypothetical protein
MSACGWFAGQPELLAGIHLGHAARHLFLPGRRLLLQAVQIRTDLLPLPFRDLGELLFELKHGDGAHVGSLEEAKAFATPDAARLICVPDDDKRGSAIFRLLRAMVIPQTNRSSLRHQHWYHLVAVAAVDEEIIVQGENDGVFVKFGKSHEAGVGE